MRALSVQVIFLLFVVVCEMHATDAARAHDQVLSARRVRQNVKRPAHDSAPNNELIMSSQRSISTRSSVDKASHGCLISC